MAIFDRARSFTWTFNMGLVALLAATFCLVPTAGWLLAWHMQLDLGAFMLYAVVPALVALAACELYLASRSPLLFNRLVAGLVGGVAGMLAFDLVRLPGAYMAKWAPDWVPLIGQHLLDETIGIAPTMRASALGVGYHYLLIGALMGAAYSLILGKGRWWWASATALVAGIGFMFLPQARLLTVATGFDLIVANITWAIAFAVGGAVLGGVVQWLGRTRTNAFYVVFAREKPVEVASDAAERRYTPTR